MAWNVTAAFDKASYSTGETIKCSISGDYVTNTTSAGVAGPLQIPVVSEDGTKASISVPQVTVTFSTDVHEDVKIDPSAPIVDTSPTPRVWTISADGKSITAVA